jgi:long-chain fatty acid transport protein
MIIPSASYKSAAGTETKQEDQTFLAPSVYLTYAMDNGLAFGVGVYAPYGLGTLWPGNWAGRFAAVKTELQSIFFNPTIAYKVSDQFAFGIGASYVTSNVVLETRAGTYSSLAPPTPSATNGVVNLDADGNAINFNAGFIYKPSPEVSIGVGYRHETKLDYEGTATFTNMQALQTFFPGGDGKTTIKLPNNIYAGIAYTGESFTLEGDFQYVGWSSYDVLAVEIEDGPAAPPALGGQPLQTSPEPSKKEWNNSFIIRGGGEYRLGGLALRAGVIYDKTPQPDAKVEPILPDANRIEFTVGFGYNFTESLSVDAAYQIIIWSERTAPAYPTDADLDLLKGGLYNTTANLFGLNLVYVVP